MAGIRLDNMAGEHVDSRQVSQRSGSNAGSLASNSMDYRANKFSGSRADSRSGTGAGCKAAHWAGTTADSRSGNKAGSREFGKAGNWAGNILRVRKWTTEQVPRHIGKHEAEPSSVISWCTLQSMHRYMPCYLPRYRPCCLPRCFHVSCPAVFL